MAWEESIKSDIGIDIVEFDSRRLPYNKYTYNYNSLYTIRCHIKTNSDDNPIYLNQSDGVAFPDGLIGVNNGDRIVTGFRLKDLNGNLLDKYLVFRLISGSSGMTTQKYWHGQGGWYIYDRSAETYTAISTSSGNSYGNESGSMTSATFDIIFTRTKYQMNNTEYDVLWCGVRANSIWSNFTVEYIEMHGATLNYGALSSYIVDLNYSVHSNEYGEASIPDGYTGGTFDDTSDEITIPTKPTLSALNAAFLHAYYISNPNLLNDIGKCIFPPNPVLETDILKSLDSIAQQLFYNKQIDYILDCHIIPVIPQTSGSENIKAGGHDLSYVESGTVYYLYAPVIHDGFIDFDCGSLSIPEYWANFLDFSSGTKIKLFLPFIGFIDLKPELIIGGTLTIKYRFNVVDGTFMCYVLSTSGKSNLTNSLIGQYSGCACLHIPLQSADYSRVVSGLLSTITMAGGLVSGNVGAVATGAVSTITTIMGSKPDVQQSNGYNTSASYLSKRTPYVMIERVSSQFSRNYPKEMGLPLNVTRKLNTIQGFTIIENPVLDIQCSDAEYNELIALLKSGVIF